ncbi:MAG: hypothetical protein ACLRNQ_07330 [Flavonifractor plautii]
MDGATIAMFVFQTVITAIIGVAAWGVKNAIGEMKAAVSELKAADKKNAEEIAAVRGELGDLKADLPSSTRPGRTSSGSRTTSTRSSTSSYTGAQQRRDKSVWHTLTT